MTYAATEQSVSSGKPVELYKFVNGSDSWLYTSAQDKITYNSEDYAAALLSRSEIQQTNEFGKSNITIETVRDNDVAAKYIVAPPQGAMSLTIFREHFGDGNFITYWKGRVVSVQFADSKATMTCENVFTKLRNGGLRKKCQLGCVHALYDGGCTLDAADFSTVTTVGTVSGVTVTAAAFSDQVDGYFTGGKLTAPDAKRMIISHTGDTIMLSAPIIGLAAGDAITAAAGCDHSLSTCHDKFSNEDNYGGFPFTPQKNPFSGDAIV